MRPTAVAIIALLLAASGCSASNETGTTAPQATTGAATEQPLVSTSTTQGPVASSEAEGALVVSVQTHDPDGVWVGWPEADILKFAHSVCRIADDVAYITEADPSLPPGIPDRGTQST